METIAAAEAIASIAVAVVDGVRRYNEAIAGQISGEQRESCSETDADTMGAISSGQPGGA